MAPGHIGIGMNCYWLCVISSVLYDAMSMCVRVSTDTVLTWKVNVARTLKSSLLARKRNCHDRSHSVKCESAAVLCLITSSSSSSSTNFSKGMFHCSTPHTHCGLWLRLQSWLMPQSPYRLRNDLKCVEWDVKPCSIQSMNFMVTQVSNKTSGPQ